MLKIRISGKESELRQVARKVGTNDIKRFKRNNGKTTFALDVQISLQDFLQNMDLSDSKQYNCNAQEIQTELEELLNKMDEPK